MICVCLNGANLKKNTVLLNQNAEHADLAELRVDLLTQSEQEWEGIETWGRQCSIPCIFTIRETADGGNWQGTAAAKKNLILLAAKSGCFSYIDIEAPPPESSYYGMNDANERKQVLEELRNVSSVSRAQTKLIISEHKFEEDRQKNTIIIKEHMLERILFLARQYPDAIIKYAAQCHSTEDFVHFLRISKILRQSLDRYVLVPMGSFGQAARILSHLSKSLWTYCIAEESKSSRALGQLSARNLSRLYRYRELGLNVNSRIPVFAVIGNPVLHSKSPEFFNSHFAEQHIPAVYIHLHIDTLEHLSELQHALNIKGMSVTLPHKETILPLLSSSDNAVQACGACNTVLCKQKRWVGSNTDAPGFLYPLLRAMNISSDLVENKQNNVLAGKKITVVGAGGAAKAVVYALQLCSASILIANRSAARAEALKQDFPHADIRCSSLDNYRDIQSYSDCIVQTTSVGMGAEETALPNFPFHKKMLAYDCIYTPPLTRFLREAKKAGARIIMGTEMFVQQARLQAELFTREPLKNLSVDFLETKNPD